MVNVELRSALYIYTRPGLRTFYPKLRRKKRKRVEYEKKITHQKIK
jgi:hypothetical protein